VRTQASLPEARANLVLPKPPDLSPTLRTSPPPGYSFVYFSSTLEIMGFVSTMLYFSYMFICSLLFGITTGTIGFVSSYWFVLQIYGAVKVD